MLSSIRLSNLFLILPSIPIPGIKENNNLDSFNEGTGGKKGCRVKSHSRVAHLSKTCDT